ncbi:MAG: efflux RND transporter periplasmic adaptor subunit [Gammaproteobacteria bacterium]
MSPRMPDFRTVAILAAGGLLMAVSTAGRAQGGPGGQMPPTAVETAVVTAGALTDSISAVGTLRADESVVIRPELAGRIERIHFEEGQRVARGDPLFSLDASLIRSELREAEANLAMSRRAFERAQDLIGRKLIAQADYDDARSQLEIDEARLASARTRLDKTVINAPFEGVTGLRQVSPGDYVEIGQALVSLVQLDPIKVDFSVPEVHLARLDPGQTIEVRLDAFPNESFRGEVTAIDPQIDVNGRSVVLRAVLPNEERRLRPGLFARLHLELAQHDDALLIPEQALWPQGEQQFVYRVEEGQARLVEVQTGIRRAGRVQIVSGLQAGDEIVTAGQLKLFDGAAVAPVTPANAAAGAMPAAGSSRQ